MYQNLLIDLFTLVSFSLGNYEWSRYKTSVYRVLCRHKFSVYLDKYQGARLLDLMVKVCLVFLRNHQTVFRVGAPLCTSTSKGQAFPLPFLFYPCQCLLFVLFLMIAILIGVSRCLTVILICISLMINDVEHLSSLVFKWYPYKYKFSLILNSLCHSIDLFDYFLTIDNVTKLLKIYRVLW